MASASSSARALLSSRLKCARLATWSRLSTTTTAATMEVTPRTCLPLIPSRIGGCLLFFRPQSQLVQFVVKGLEADAQNFRSPRLVVACVFEGHHDQPPLGFFHGNPGRERHLGLRRGLRLLSERRRQVLRLDERSRRQDRRPLDDISQLADVARPRVLL